MILRQGFSILLCAFLLLPSFVFNALCFLFFCPVDRKTVPRRHTTPSYPSYFPCLCQSGFTSFSSVTNRSSRMLGRHFTKAVLRFAMAKLVGHGWAKRVFFLLSCFLQFACFVSAMIYETFSPPKKQRRWNRLSQELYPPHYTLPPATSIFTPRFFRPDIFSSCSSSRQNFLGQNNISSSTRETSHSRLQVVFFFNQTTIPRSFLRSPCSLLISPPSDETMCSSMSPAALFSSVFLATGWDK